MAGMLSKLAKDLELQGPDRTGTSPVDDLVAPQTGNVPSRLFAALPIRSLNRLDRVAPLQCERAVDGPSDPDLPVRPARDRLVEPHALDEGRMLDKTQQRRLRRHEATTRLFLRQVVQGVKQDGSVLVEQLLDAEALLSGPVR